MVLIPNWINWELFVHTGRTRDSLIPIPQENCAILRRANQCFPSGENFNVSICCVCPSRAAILSPVLASHNWIVPLACPLTRIAPSGENTNDLANHEMSLYLVYAQC